MSAAAPETVEEDGASPPPPKTRSKKLILIIAAALLVVLVGGGATTYIMKKRAAAAAEAEGDEPSERAKPKLDLNRTPPVFLPLEPFVVNLADRDPERFAQIGITLEVDDQSMADKLKAYMPAIRNGILLVLSQKTANELFGRAGKNALANEIMRESVRPLGIEFDEPLIPDVSLDDEDSADAGHGSGGEDNPVRRVHFSSFIIQ